MAAKKDQASIREEFRRELGPGVGTKMAQSIHAALDSMETKWFECQHCHKKNPLVQPNAFERAKACQTVIEQLEGKVGTHKDAPATPKIKAGDMDSMSDDDLLALLQGGSDGETDDDGAEEDPDL